jgi:PAS domain S-box-containing protein
MSATNPNQFSRSRIMPIEPLDLKSWRNWFAKLMIILVAVGIPLNMIVTLPQHINEKHYAVIAINTCIWLYAVIRTLIKSRSYQVNVYIFFAILYIWMISLFVTLGPGHARPAWLIMCPVLAAMLFGLRAAVISVVANAMILMILYVIIGPENQAWASEYAAPFGNWINFVVNISMLSLATSVPVGFMLSKLDRSLKDERKAHQELSAGNEKLQTAYALLETEIEQRKKTEEALAKSEKKYRLFAENTTDVIWTTDMNLNVTYVSPSAQGGIGYSTEETLLRKAEKLLTPESLAVATQVFAEELEIEKNLEKRFYRSRTLELEFRHKDGFTRWSETKLSFIRDSNGEAIGILGVGRDITERKAMEKEKKKLEAQLVQAQKMEAIGSLAGGVAHDFNNILSAIIGYTELSQMDIPKESHVSAYLDQILKAGNRAKDLVQQILTFSRQAEKELKPISVKVIVKEALKLLRATLPTTIHISHNIESDSLVMGDPTQIHQILMNLCTNAGHAMQEKGGILEVNLTNVELDAAFASRHPDLKPGPYLNLSVSDTGHGMSPDVLKQIFDPFFTTKERGEGTGMGLAVVHGIVNSYGGTIYAYSEPGKGSSFKVFLPVISSSLKSEKRMERDVPRGAERVLFIDDEQALVDMGKQALESLGYQVVTRTSSLEALNLFRAQPDRFDLVITDMTMPQMTGDKLAEALITLRRDIPIILCTGFSYGMTEEKAKGMGIKAFIMKPFVVRDLANKVRKVLDEK